MKRVSVCLVAGLLYSARAETITFRNGATVTGTLVNFDGAQVTFLINHHVQTYSRMDVTDIIFNSETRHSAAPAVTVNDTSLAIAASVPPEGSVREPDLIGAVYFQDASGNLVPLERKGPVEGRKSPGVAGVFIPGAGNAGRYWEISGARSAVRVKQSPKMLFVVRVAAGIDPSSFSLYPLEVRKDARRLKAPPSKAGLLTIATTVTTFGTSSYGLSAGGMLPEGEYVFSPTGLQDGYCFGVDPAAPAAPSH